MSAPTRTPRTSWIDEGLRALGAGGPDAVRVELLAQALGVTKGGFYWHFEDRRALLEELLDAWERGSVDEVIERVESEGADPRARLRRLSALAASSDAPLRIDLAVRDWARREPTVAERLRRVDNRRMDYLRSLFGAFCPDEDDVEARCMVFYSLLDRQPLHRRRSRRAQPGGRAQAGPDPTRGVGTRRARIAISASTTRTPACRCAAGTASTGRSRRCRPRGRPCAWHPWPRSCSRTRSRRRS